MTLVVEYKNIIISLLIRINLSDVNIYSMTFKVIFYVLIAVMSIFV